MPRRPLPSLVPGPFQEEGERKGLGTHCLCMRQTPQKPWGFIYHHNLLSILLCICYITVRTPTHSIVYQYSRGQGVAGNGASVVRIRDLTTLAP